VVGPRHGKIFALLRGATFRDTDARGVPSGERAVTSMNSATPAHVRDSHVCIVVTGDSGAARTTHKRRRD